MTVADAYKREYHNEDLLEGWEIKRTIKVQGIEILLTFEALIMAMSDANYGDFYDIIGVYDSVVREKIFSLMAKHFNASYENIYNIWCNN